MEEPTIARQPPSPFHRRRVQTTILVIVLVAAVWTAARVGLDTYSAKQNAMMLEGVESLVMQLDINRADARELSLLPQIGPTLAQRIVDNRAQFGPFLDVNDLNRVPGIGEKKIDGLRQYCFVGDSVEVASEELVATD